MVKRFKTLASHAGNMGSIPVRVTKKKHICKADVLFQLYSPLASDMHFVRDIAYGSDMRYARLK